MDDDFSYTSRNPVVRVETGPWGRIVDVDGLGLRRALDFAREVTWIRDASAQAVLVNKAGKEVETGSQFCDVNQFMGCVAEAIRQARDLAEEHEVGDGPFGVVVRLTVTDKPVLALPPHSWERAGASRRWRDTPADWIVGANVAAINAWIETPKRGPAPDGLLLRLKGNVVMEDEVVWDSRTGSPSGLALGIACERAVAGLDDAAAGDARQRMRDLVAG